MTKYVMAIDQGTTGSTVLLLDEQMEVHAKGYREFEQIYPNPGWVEHDPEAIWTSVRHAVASALEQAHADPSHIAAIGITNQRETTVLWEKSTGRPIANAIVWQCRRTADFCEELRAQGKEAEVSAKTGLVLDPYFSGTKVRWLLDNVAGARDRALKGELAFGTVDSFLLWRLTGGKVHATDLSNASRTLLMNIETLSWDEGLCGLFQVPMSVLPEIRSCSEVYGHTQGLDFLPDGIPVAGMAGDQQAALFGQACFSEGQAKCTYGTGAFLMVNTGDKLVRSDKGLLTTVGWRVKDQVTYALEGSVFIAGAAVQWLRDGLGIIEKAPEIEDLARSVPDSGELVFVPALAGLGAPYWKPDARGLMMGISRGTTAAHVARATLEGIALSVHDVLGAMQDDLGRPLAGLRVDGGAAANNLLMQLQADLLGSRIVRPVMLETTGLGAALLAGLGAGVWSDLQEIERRWRKDREFEPAQDRSQAQVLLERWRKAVALL